jgi:CheY-like chemotaxis protein
MKKVLIVDDEEDILTSVKMLVEDSGYSAETVNSGGKALKALGEKKYDLVLLDILMPGMSGKEVLEKIRADPKLKNQKVAFMTVVQLAKQGEDSIKRLKPVEYFEKPVRIGDFRTRLQKVLM